jgi:hypothetical protein
MLLSTLPDEVFLALIWEVRNLETAVCCIINASFTRER